MRQAIVREAEVPGSNPGMIIMKMLILPNNIEIESRLFKDFVQQCRGYGIGLEYLGHLPYTKEEWRRGEKAFIILDRRAEAKVPIKRSFHDYILEFDFNIALLKKSLRGEKVDIDEVTGDYLRSYRTYPRRNQQFTKDDKDAKFFVLFIRKDN